MTFGRGVLSFVERLKCLWLYCDEHSILVDDSDAEHIRILMTITAIAVMKINSFFANFNFYFCMHLWWLMLCSWWQHLLLVTMKMMIVTKRTSKCFVQVLLLQPFAVVATNRPKPSIFEAPSDAKTANFSTGSCSSFLFCFWECLFPSTKWLL